MLCDPFKYQDYVNKFLDGIEEEEDQRTQGRPYRKRTRSSNFIMGQTLPDIDEETYEQMKECVVRNYKQNNENKKHTTSIIKE